MIENKNILIIGGSSGIGLALAELISPNNNIYIASRSKESLSHLNSQSLLLEEIIECAN